MYSTGILVFLTLSYVTAEIHFNEKFDDATWEAHWVYSEHPNKEFGKFAWSSGKFFRDPEDKGIKTTEDARFYALSKKFPPFSSKGKTLVFQHSVKHEQDIDCGGGYAKYFDCSLDQKNMHGETPYDIMFGPDICGPGTKKVHVILSYKGEHIHTKKDIRCKDDVFTHMYTLILRPDNTYEVHIDDEKVESGNLEDDWDFLPVKKIKDPNAKKPDDWEDKPTIDDPEDKKPEDWDKPETIDDPEAVQEEGWDKEMDGEWEPPQIPNPDYKGEWKPKQIDNPKYKGPWVHPEIDNPEYAPDPELYHRKEICSVGLDLWQVKSGTIFDNILVTDDEAHAKNVIETVWKPLFEAEKKMKEAHDEEEKKQREAEMKAGAGEAGEADEEDDEDEDEEAADKPETGEEEQESVHDEF